MNKAVNNLLEAIQQLREEWESESARAQLSQTSSVADTQLLIAAIGTGQSRKRAAALIRSTPDCRSARPPTAGPPGPRLPVLPYLYRTRTIPWSLHC